jgi:hypothetical protein
MAARKKSAARKQTSARRSSSRAPRDALALLRADHQTVQGLFDKFEKARGEDRKASLAREICNELKVHCANRGRDFLSCGARSHSRRRPA